MIYDKNDADFEGKVQQVSNIRRKIVARIFFLLFTVLVYSFNLVPKYTDISYTVGMSSPMGKKI